MPGGSSFKSDALRDLWRRHRIRRLCLFGPTLEGTARPASRVDLLVEFWRDAKPARFDRANIERDPPVLLGGRRVDAHAPADLSRYFRDEMVREAEVRHVMLPACEFDGAPKVPA